MWTYEDIFEISSIQVIIVHVGRYERECSRNQTPLIFDHVMLTQISLEFTSRLDSHFVDVLDDEVERVDGPLGHLVAEALVVSVERLPVTGEHLERLEPGARVKLLVQVPADVTPG